MHGICHTDHYPETPGILTTFKILTNHGPEHDFVGAHSWYTRPRDTSGARRHDGCVL